MCHLSPQDQHVCQSHHGIAEAVAGVLGSTQFPSCSFYHPRSTRSRFRSTRKAAICAGNFPDSNGISDDCKRQKRSHQTEPVPSLIYPLIIFCSARELEIGWYPFIGYRWLSTTT